VDILLVSLLVIAILSSPLWISWIILAIPARFWFLDLLLCVLQGLIAYPIWWFFWGGGIGGELGPTPALQLLFVSAGLPLVAWMRKRRKARKRVARGFPVTLSRCGRPPAA
jgi:hypothetical protein